MNIIESYFFYYPSQNIESLTEKINKLARKKVKKLGAFNNKIHI